MDPIYQRPRDYDLEHEGDDEDVAFYAKVLEKSRAEIRFLYDKFPGGDRVDRYVSDFDRHVYYPREVELLYRTTGFFMEGWSATTHGARFAQPAVS